MGRQPRRASGVKALQAIKETRQTTRTKPTAKKYQGRTENDSSQQQQAGLKRTSSPGSIVLPSAKRNALGDVTNNAVQRQVTAGKQAGTRKTERQTQQSVALKKVTVRTTAPAKKTGVPVVKKTTVPIQRKQTVPAVRKTTSTAITKETTQRKTSTSVQKTDLDESVGPSQSSTECEPTPVTAVQNFLQATTLNDVSFHSEESLVSEESLSTTSSVPSSQEQPREEIQLWKDIDKAEEKDPLFSAEYAPDIYTYMMEREELLAIPDYMSKQTDINASMRTILIDWLVEVQENFELFHETLYIAVRLVDTYLSRREVKREYLQLVGATSMLVAAKFEELCPPLVDDFLYLCDDAYTREDLLKMERDILKAVNYDVNMSIAYRFLRRLARACEATMETHTLARYFTEHSLQEYEFVTEKPSYIAAAAMYLALRMKKLGSWTPTLEHYSGYKVEEMLPMVKRLNSLIQRPLGQTATVRSKYSHEVFFKVALTPPLPDVEKDAKEALLESTITSSQ